MRPSTSKLFLPTEYPTAQELIEFADDAERFSYEYLIVYKLLDKDQVFIPQLMKQAMRLMVQRHQNMTAYYVKNSDGSIERKYKNYDGTVYIEFNTIKEAQIRPFIKEGRKLETFTSLPMQRYFFAKTEENYYIMSYSHHAFKDVLIDQILMEELLNIYEELVKNPKASFQEATKNLKKIASYDEVLLDFHNANKEKLNKLVVFLRPKFQCYVPPKDSLLDHNTSLCKANRIRSIFYDSQAIINKQFKPNICLLSLALLSLQKNFKVEGTLPIWKLNGSRPKIAEGVLCSYIKDQVFVHPLNQNNTFKMQYEENYCHNRENLMLFNECDHAEALEILSEQLEKDCIPKVCFNFYHSNMSSKRTVVDKDLCDEYDVVNSIMNIYFDVMFNSVTKEYSITIFYKRSIFEDQMIREIMEFINLGYKYLHLISNVRISQISLEYLRNLDKIAVKTLKIAKPKL